MLKNLAPLHSVSHPQHETMLQVLPLGLT